MVDMGDYVVWRKGLGTIYTQSDYHCCGGRIGPNSSRGWASANTVIPEPGVGGIVIVGSILSLGLWRRAAVGSALAHGCFGRFVFQIVYAFQRNATLYVTPG